MKHDLGAILLIAGTTVGAGILALPAVTSPLGLFVAIALYIGVFGVMLISAKYFTKLVLHFDHPHNFVCLAKKTLGPKGEACCWVIYLLLMYALVAAYISACASMLAPFFPLQSTLYSEVFLILLLPSVFALFLTLGLKGIDHLNRVLMFGLILSFVMLCVYLCSSATFHFDPSYNFTFIRSALPIAITSFGYHIIIPTVATYLNKDYKRIIRAVYIGSFIPLIIYVTWHLLIYFNLSSEQLAACLKKDIPLTEMLTSMHPKIALYSVFFSILVIITSFLGVALSLYDFLKDSLPKKTLFKNKKIIFALTFLPPLIYIFYFKKAFYLALDHAGILVSLLLIILPALMYLKISKKLKMGAVILIITGSFVIISDIIGKSSLNT